MRSGLVASALLAVAACGDQSAPLAASEVVIMTPIPGQDRTVAYLTLENRGTLPLTLDRITSPQFDMVEMHATIVDGGVTGMQALDALIIAEGSIVEFTAGGRHLMLIKPREALETGDTVTLEFHHNRAGLLVLSAPLQSRLPDERE